MTGGPEELFAGSGEVARLLRAYSWKTVPLGVPNAWPADLKAAVRLMLALSLPMGVGWGPDRLCLYNDALARLIGRDHPRALGRPIREIPFLAAVATAGRSDPQRLVLEQGGRREERYFAASCSALPGGVLCIASDETNRVVADRELALLRALAPAAWQVQSHREACEQLAVALAHNPHDLPFVLIYLLEPGDAMATLAARVGNAIDAPDCLALDAGKPWPIGEVLNARKVVHVDNSVLLPILEGDTVRGVVVAGLNPLRPFDDAYQGFLELVVAHVAAAIAEVDARRIREVAEHERIERHFQYFVQGVRDYALFMLDPAGIITTWNIGAERIKGYAASEIIGQHFSRFYTAADRAADVPARALATAADKGSFEAEGARVRKDGSEFWASVVINSIRDKDGNLLGFAKITRDITERREAQQALQRAQEQLAQAQKMEGIGQLTGGVAHDFNNLLTVIIGNLEAMQRALQAPPIERDRVSRSIDNAMRGAQRGASLTQRLLAFSRRQPLDPKPVDGGRLVVAMSDLLRRTLGEHIAIETVLAGGLWQVLADPNQLEIAILNLAVNARDAMPSGGKLTIETANARLDETYAAHDADVVAGDYVVISVTDTGVGMTREVQARAFEPFYTTKDIGHGTGLGLSQVYGFVKQSGGHVKLYSEAGLGTTVKIYLPRLPGDEAAVAAPEPAAVAPRSGTGQTILVVEDDDDVRADSTGILRELGYSVLEASIASSALHAVERHPEIKLLFTDIGLPGGMNGRQLADAARRLRPDLKVLYTTGYARDAIMHDGRLDPGVTLVQKPFTYATLAAKLAEILDDHVRSSLVLLVEDEVLVRMVATDQLQELGYRVEAAGSARDALDKAKLMAGDIGLAIVDVGLPDAKGDTLVTELRRRHPELPIIVATGYDDPELRRRFEGDRRIAFLRKPYTQADLKQIAPAMHKS
jgi:PAS domain S-box-containing protein